MYLYYKCKIVTYNSYNIYTFYINILFYVTILGLVLALVN